MFGRRRREMAELQALQRAVWGDITDGRYRAEQRSRLRRGIGAVSMAVGVAIVGLGLAVTSLPGPEESARRDLGRSPSTSRATTVRPTTVTTPIDTARRTPSTPAPTSATNVTRPALHTTTVPARRPRKALARTGAHTDALIAIGVALVAAGLALARRKSERSRVRAS